MRTTGLSRGAFAIRVVVAAVSMSSGACSSEPAGGQSANGDEEVGGRRPPPDRDDAGQGDGDSDIVRPRPDAGGAADIVDEAADDGASADGGGSADGSGACGDDCEVPDDDTCSACESPSDCGDGATCAEIGGGRFCLPLCGSEGECPPTFACVGETLCLPVSRSCDPEACTGGLDEDGDSAVDCDDPDCAADEACAPDVETECSDGLDDDDDGLADCLDTDCELTFDCLETDCVDGVDNEGDGEIDCEDADCVESSACLPDDPEDCSGGGDEDGDGSVDCDDADCEDAPECAPQEDCDNGRDDDGDLDADCADAECSRYPACTGDTPCDLALPVRSPGVHSSSTSGRGYAVQLDPTATCWIGTYGYTVGRDVMFEVVVPGESELRVEMVSSGWAIGTPSLYLLDACDPAAALGYCTDGWGTCIDSSHCLGAAAAALPVVTYRNYFSEPETVYVVVDGHTAWDGPFELEFSW